MVNWLSSPIRADQLDSLFFRLRQQLLSQLPLIQVSSHGIECFGHRQSFPPSSRPACQTKIRFTVVQTVPHQTIREGLQIPQLDKWAAPSRDDNFVFNIEVPNFIHSGSRP